MGEWGGLGAGEKLLVTAVVTLAAIYLALAGVMLWGPLKDIWDALLSLVGR
jgi:hypothetical protein